KGDTKLKKVTSSLLSGVLGLGLGVGIMTAFPFQDDTETEVQSSNDINTELVRFPEKQVSINDKDKEDKKGVTLDSVDKATIALPINPIDKASQVGFLAGSSYSKAKEISSNTGSTAGSFYSKAKEKTTHDKREQKKEEKQDK